MLETGRGILAGLIVRNDHIDALVAAFLGDLAENLMHLIVLVGGHVEKRAAVLAGIARRAGIRTDQEGPGIRHRLVDRQQDVGEDRPHHEIDLVAFQQALDLGDGGVRLEFVIGHHDLDIAARHLAAEILDGERKAVADLLAERCRRTGQGHDHADLELLLRDGLIGRDTQQNRQSGQFQMLLHDFSPDRRATSTKLFPNPNFRPAYSDDGCRRKQGSSKPGPKSTGTHSYACKPRANYLKPKEIARKRASRDLGVLTCSTP